MTARDACQGFLMAGLQRGVCSQGVVADVRSTSSGVAPKAPRKRNFVSLVGLIAAPGYDGGLGAACRRFGSSWERRTVEGPRIVMSTKKKLSATGGLYSFVFFRKTRGNCL